MYTCITVMIIRSTENRLCSKFIHISRLLIDEATQIKMLFMGNADGEVNNFILTLIQSSTASPQHFTLSTTFRPVPSSSHFFARFKMREKKDLVD